MNPCYNEPQIAMPRILKFLFLALLLRVFFGGMPALAQEKELRWAGDAQGGAPYVFKGAKDLTRPVGFEVDIAEALARRMKRRPVFVQNQWDGLIPGLQAHTYDIALNGIEITEERKQEVAFSLPYYATAEQLTVRNDTTGISTLHDVAGKPVGTLKGSLAQHILEQFNTTTAAGIKVVTYDDQNTAYEDLAIRRTDAVLMDFPIALYCADPARMKGVGPPIGSLRYGIAVNKSDTALLTEINQALTGIIRSGELRAIYQKWGLWNPETRTLFTDLFPNSPAAFTGETATTGQELDAYRAATFKPIPLSEKLRTYLVVYLPLLITRGAGMTLLLSIAGMTLAICGGLLLAAANLYGIAPVRWLARGYIELVRGTPLLIQLYLIYYGLPRIGLKLPPFAAAVIGLGLNYAAYEAENYRAGVQAVPRGQMEAALALGLSRFQAVTRIILPQALRLTIPPVTNDFVSLLKDSSIVSVITMVELTKTFGELAMVNFDFIGLGILTALLYFVLGMPFVQLARYAESRFTPDGRSQRPGVRRWFTAKRP